MGNKRHLRNPLFYKAKSTDENTLLHVTQFYTYIYLPLYLSISIIYIIIHYLFITIYIDFHFY